MRNYRKGKDYTRPIAIILFTTEMGNKIQNLVANPPSNIRKSPNEEFLCSVREKKTINVYGSTGSWYGTDICATMGVIDASQVTFQPK